jgi:putative mRNA 3-end processing factor
MGAMPLTATLLRLTDHGLHCEAGGFHVDPWGPVARAVITHAHGDHLAHGCGHYLTSASGRSVTQRRLGAGASVEALDYGAVRSINGVRVSLHPAGHILGSSQVRLEHRGEVWVVSGDYKVEPDPTCAPFESVRCHTFVTESTFGLPVYRWPAQHEVFDAIHAWWRANQADGRTSLLLGYALGKAQRLLAGLDPSVGPILTHGAVEQMAALYRAEGIALPATVHALAADRSDDWSRAIVVAPPGTEQTPWGRRFGDAATAMTSGWMRVRGARRRRGVERGFTLSDHADWPGLLEAIAATGASRVWVTHGFTAPVVRWLQEKGLEARAIATRFEGDERIEVQPADAPEP